MAEWSKTQLSDILVDKGYIRGPFGSALKRGDMKDNGVPVYEQQHAIYDSRCFRYYIDEQKFVEMKRFQVNTDDLIISCSGTVGKVSIIRDDDPKGIISQALLLLRVDKNKILPLYLKYFFSSRDGYNAIVSRSSGSVQVNIAKRDVIEQIPLMLPKIETQRKIVGVLNSIDKKIEENERINNNLEQQADALYQTFFSPKSGTQGKIVTLDEYCSIFTGKKNANASVNGGKYKFFTCAPEALQIDSYIFDGNAIIVSGNGAYTGRTRFYSGKFDLYQRTYACTLLDNVNPDFIFPLYWFVKLELSKKIMGGTRGSAIPYIVMNDLAKFEFIYNEEMFANYTPLFKSLTEAIQANEFESENLAQIRDSLLPKLMSGELDVSDTKL